MFNGGLCIVFLAKIGKNTVKGQKNSKKMADFCGLRRFFLRGGVVFVGF